MSITGDLTVHVLKRLWVSTTLRRDPICFQKNILYQHTRHNLIGHNRNHPSTWQVQKGCSYKLHTQRKGGISSEARASFGRLCSKCSPCMLLFKKKKKDRKNNFNSWIIFVLCFITMSSGFPSSLSISLPLCLCQAWVCCPIHNIFSSAFAQCLKGSGPAVGLKLSASVLIHIYIKKIVFWIPVV